MTFSYYVSDEAPEHERFVHNVVFTRWLCSCGSGGYGLDTATFWLQVISHLRVRHGGPNAAVVGNIQRCTAELVAFVERQVLG